MAFVKVKQTSVLLFLLLLVPVAWFPLPSSARLKMCVQHCWSKRTPRSKKSLCCWVNLRQSGGLCWRNGSSAVLINHSEPEKKTNTNFNKANIAKTFYKYVPDLNVSGAQAGFSTTQQLLSCSPNRKNTALAQWLVSASQLEGWVFDPRPLSELP